MKINKSDNKKAKRINTIDNSDEIFNDLCENKDKTKKN